MPYPLQSPVPTSEGEILLFIGVLVWLLAMFIIGRRLNKISKRHSEVISFAVFVIGVLVLLLLLY